jgi:formylglycine-generating enzyme required for sulfatase activity
MQIFGIIFVLSFLLCANASAQLDLDSAKKKCSELGFKSGTEQYGKCVLQLSKSDLVAPVTNSGSQSKKNIQTKIFKDCDDCPEMAVIPAGNFLMGSKADPFLDHPPPSNEQPQHLVSIKAFALGRYEVTQEQWYALMGGTPSRFKGRKLPVEQISWGDAQEFLKKLSEKTGKMYRLPSEAEWEYAARAGTVTQYFFGDAISQQQANFNSFETQVVGSYPANAYGLHDMHGNVWEWTSDCWNANYDGAPTDGSAWINGACGSRVLRGGALFSKPYDLRSSSRIWNSIGDRHFGSGFRVARSL